MQWDIHEEWDGLDLLAALGQAATLLATPDSAKATLDRRESALRLTGLWNYIVSRFSVLPARIRAGQNPRTVASQWRAHGWFEQLDEKDRHWLLRQMLIEVSAAWHALSSLLTSGVPEAARILGLAALSPQTSLLL